MMMRTRRRLTRPPNKRKSQRLHELATVYARQKDAYLVELAKAKIGASGNHAVPINGLLLGGSVSTNSRCISKISASLTPVTR